MKSSDKNDAEGIKWPIPDVLACSEHPGFPNHTVHVREVDQWLNAVRQRGIRSVINLLSKEEMTVYYRHLGRPLIEYYSDAGLAVRHVSDEDMGVIVPSHVFLDRVLTAFEVLPRPVLVHCSAGAERSALAVDFICNQWRTRLQKPVVKPHKKSPAKKRRT